MSVKVVFDQYDYDDFGADIVLDEEEMDEDDIEEKSKELNEKYPYVVSYSFEGVLDTQAEIYCETFAEAQKNFDDILSEVMAHDAECANPFFPEDKEERDAYLEACNKVGCWESGASWQIDIIPSGAQYLYGEERKAFMIANGITEKDFDAATRLLAKYEPEW